MYTPKYVSHKRKETAHTSVKKKGQRDLSYDEKQELKKVTLDTLHNLNTIDKHFVKRTLQGVVYLDKDIAQDALHGRFTPVEVVTVESQGNHSTFKDTRVLIQMHREVELAYTGKHTEYRILNHVYFVVSLTRKSLVTGYVAEVNKLKKSRKGLI